MVYILILIFTAGPPASPSLTSQKLGPFTALSTCQLAATAAKTALPLSIKEAGCFPVALGVK